MVRYFFRFSYLGTNYRGLQKNTHHGLIRDCDSIQGSLELAFATLIPKSIIRPSVLTSSRTDAGVHALCNTGHVELENKYNTVYDPDTVLKYVNRYLIRCKHDIRLLDFIPVTDDFHARFSAKSRTYLYRFMIPKDPKIPKVPILELSQCFLLRSEIFDIERVINGTQLFMGPKDFQTFCANSRTSHPIRFVRELKTFSVERGQPLMPFDPLSDYFHFWHITCSAKAFLYNQIRRMVGALMCLGVGIITEKDIVRMLQVPAHNNFDSRIVPVPPHGLYLQKVEYDEDFLDQCTIKCNNQNVDNVEIQQ